MNVENVIVMMVTIICSIASIIMLRYEWLKQEKTEDVDFWKFPKWLWIYGVTLLVVQVVLAYLLMNIYTENTICMVIKRMGLLSLVWQAAVLDWKYQKIPNDIILVGVVFRIILLVPEFLLEREMMLMNLIAEGIALALIVIVVFICLLLMKNSIGMGDFKLLMIMAICQGINGIMASVFLSMLVAFFVAVALLLSKRKTRKDTLPFAPCILAGTLAGVFLTGL